MDKSNLYFDYDPKKKILVSECKHCHRISRLETVATYSIEKYEDVFGDGQMMSLDFEYILCKCSHCSEISLAESIHDFEFLAIIYPSEKRFLNLELSEIVKTSYQAAIRCEKARIPLATVVMVGRTLEAIVKEFYPEQKTIFGGLEKLKDDGIISSEIFEWANELRVLRNIGAHAVDETIELIDAEESMDFLKAILEIVYDLRPKFIEMKKRREKSK